MSSLAIGKVSRNDAIGYLLSLAAGFSYGLSPVLIKIGVQDMTSPLVGLTIAVTAGTIVMLLPELRGRRKRPGGNERLGMLWFAAAGAAAGVAQIGNYIGLNVAPVVVVTPVAATSPLVTVVGVKLLLQRVEIVSRRTILGSIMVVAGVVFVSLGTWQG